MRPAPSTEQPRLAEAPLLALAALIALGVCCVWLLTAAASWRAFQVERLLTRDLPVATHALESTLERSRNLDTTFLPGRHLHAPALLASGLLYLQDQQWPLGVDQEELLIPARASVQRALAREPAHAESWARLAYLRHRLDGPSPETLAALRLSMYIGPVKPSLLYWRLGLAARNHAFWDAQMAGLIRGQILLAWRNNPRMLAQAAATHGLLPIIRVVLAGDPEQLAVLESLITRHVSP